MQNYQSVSAMQNSPCSRWSMEELRLADYAKLAKLAKLRRTRLGLPPTATDEECAAEEAAARRIRLGFPATATDQECAAREDGLAPGELAAWCGGWRGWVHDTPNTSYGYGYFSSFSSSEASAAAAAAADLAAAVRRLALASLLQYRLAEDSPAEEDGVKLLDVLPEVAVAAAKKAVRAVLLHGESTALPHGKRWIDHPMIICAEGHKRVGVGGGQHSSNTAVVLSTSIAGSNGNPHSSERQVTRAPQGCTGRMGRPVSMCAHTLPRWGQGLVCG